MSDDHQVLVGAAAPTRTRVVQSMLVLDALWVFVAGAALIASSFFSLGEFRPTSLGERDASALSLGDASLRVFAVGVPVVAMLIAVAALLLRSYWLAATATGVIAPGAALVGAVGASLFFDREAAYADFGVAVAVVASLVAMSALVRWFVYHQVALAEDVDRPVVRMSWVLGGGAVVVAALSISAAIGDAGATTAQFVVQVAVASTTVLTVLAASLTRTRQSFVMAAAAASAQVGAVIGAVVDDSDSDLDTGLNSLPTLWTGVVGLVALVAIVVVAVVGIRGARLDEIPDVDIDDESWRWTPTDDSSP